MEQLLAGLRLVVLPDCRAVSELRPTTLDPPETCALLERRRTLPKVDGESLRCEIDDLIDAAV